MGDGRSETGEYLLDCSFCSSFHRGTVMQVSPLFLISNLPVPHPIATILLDLQAPFECSSEALQLISYANAAHSYPPESSRGRASGAIRMYLVSLIDMPTASLPCCLAACLENLARYDLKLKLKLNLKLWLVAFILPGDSQVWVLTRPTEKSLFLHPLAPATITTTTHTSTSTSTSLLLPPGRHINLLVALACCAVKDTHTLRYFFFFLLAEHLHRRSVVGCSTRGWLVVAYQITQLQLHSGQDPKPEPGQASSGQNMGQPGGGWKLEPANWGLRVGVFRVLIRGN